MNFRKLKNLYNHHSRSTDNIMYNTKKNFTSLNDGHKNIHISLNLSFSRHLPLDLFLYYWYNQATHKIPNNQEYFSLPKPEIVTGNLLNV